MRYLDIKLYGINKEGEEEIYQLSQFRGEEVVVYFYPKDNTPGCTEEACDFRDNFGRIGKTILGVSPDGISSHKNFREKHDLDFILLSDEKHELAEAFGVWGEKSIYGKKYLGIVRSTFILDKTGKIKREWRNVKVRGHVDEVLESLTPGL